jgi:hypothetical protein
MTRRSRRSCARVPIQETYDFAQAPDALTAPATTHTQGKLAIRIR